MPKQILIVDDDSNVLAGLEFLLSEEGYQVKQANTVEHAKQVCAQQPVDLVLSDMNFQTDTTSGVEGLDFVRHVNTHFPDIPIIVMTGWATIEIAVNALKCGAADFVQKPWQDEHLIKSIETQIKLFQVAKKAESLSQHNRLLSSANFPTDAEGIIAESDSMKSLVATLCELAQSDMNILLTGENGTGKSMFAEFIHRHSSRKNNDLVSVNMGAIAENLFESEMFGHVKGAFTDAQKTRIGRFEMADNGTLFLDELANIPLSQQAKLLRVLEAHEFERVGSSHTQSTNVRVISATNAKLNQLIDDKLFRQDLYFRLNTIELRIPALKERVADILPLAQSFLNKHAAKYGRLVPQLTDNAINRLNTYTWPGNVRELSHVMERALFTCQQQRITTNDLNIGPPQKQTFAPNYDDGSATLEEIEKAILKSRLEYFAGNVTETAKSLGLSRSGYYRRIQKYGLE